MAGRRPSAGDVQELRVSRNSWKEKSVWDVTHGESAELQGDQN